MSPLKANDPMGFISATPLPLKSHQGLKITARSESHYNCDTPSRGEVCQQNYQRRRKQLNEEGYRAPNYRPYQMLGKPLILEEKQLILYALGQLDEKQLDDIENPRRPEEATQKTNDDANEDTPSDAPLPKKYILRRCTKSQRCLSQEVIHGRKMVNLAKLGHGFFTLIKQEEQTKEMEAQQEQHDLDEKQKSEWQSAVIDSSDDGEDPELAEDEALSLYMSDGDGEKTGTRSAGMIPSEDIPGKSTPQRSSGVTPLPHPSPSPLVVLGSSRLGRKSRRKKQFRESARPYTPGHSNINFDLEEEDEPDMHAIFRQLCALNWILEAMMTEPPLAMESITKCWNIKYRELRQNTFCKTSQQRLRKERHMENKWNNFITHPGAGHLHDSFLGLPGMQRSHRRRQSTSISRQMRSMSIQGQQGVLQRASSQQSVTTNRTTVYEGVSGSDDDTANTPREPTRGGGVEWDSASRITEVEETKSSSGRTVRSASVASERSNGRRRSVAEDKRAPLAAKPILSEQQLEEKNKEEQPLDQVSSWVAMTGQKPATDDSPPSFHFRRKKNFFKPSFPSKKHTDMAERLRDRFADVTEDKALMLHDQLEALDRDRYTRVEKKFNLIDCKKNAYISLQLADFREMEREREEESAEEKRKKKKLEDESKWFQELVHLLPGSVWYDRQCAAVMEKLQSMGKIESRKITPQKFLNVLASLKHWELCSPDIRAAIEFVREKVVDMSVEEFQAWYQLEIEDVRRARSAPPVHR